MKSRTARRSKTKLNPARSANSRSAAPEQPLAVAAPALVTWAEACLSALDVPKRDARQIAQSLVQTSLWASTPTGLRDWAIIFRACRPVPSSRARKSSFGARVRARLR
ncbi:MAG: hypothetical protein ABIZ04_09840 [Opitutus sp.]